MYEQFRNTEIEIISLVMNETGTYNPMYERPYRVTADGYALRDLAASVGSDADQVFTHSLAGVASQVIQPSAVCGGELHIPYGWAERRIRFVLVVDVRQEIGGVVRLQMHGFTSHLGVSGTAIDPDMEFIVNSCVELVNYTAVESGNYVNMVRPLSANQILNSMPSVLNDAHNFKDSVHKSNKNQGFNLYEYKMRPEDVYTGISAGYQANAHQYAEVEGGVYDTRLFLDSEAVMSRTSNNTSAGYLSNIFKGYLRGQSVGRYSTDDPHLAARAGIPESVLSNNQFFRALGRMYDGGAVFRTVFTIGDLLHLDEHIYHKLQYFYLTETTLASTHQAGLSSYWNGSDRETLIATILSAGIASLMMQTMLAEVSFTATNDTFGAEPIFTFANAVCMAASNEIQAYTDFTNRFNYEIMTDVSQNGLILYKVEATACLYGDVTVTLSIDGGPFYTYVTPCYCDSIAAPTKTSSLAQYQDVTVGVELMTNYVRENNTAKEIYVPHRYN